MPDFWSVFSLAFALTDIRWSEPYKTLSVRLVQGGIAQDEKFSPMGSLTSFERYVRLMNEKPVPESGLIVLPETIFPIPLQQLKPEIWRKFTHVTNGNAALMFGGFLRGEDGYRNTAVLVEHEKIVQSYTKKHLVPFGEYVPTGFRWFIDMLQIPMGDLLKGTTDQKAFEIDGRSSRSAFVLRRSLCIGNQRVVAGRQSPESSGESLQPRLVRRYACAASASQYFEDARDGICSSGHSRDKYRNDGLRD